MSISGLKRAGVVSVVVAAAVAAARGAAAPPLPTLAWQTVIDNTTRMPGSDATFNSYNQPSVNEAGLVVVRARSRGGEGGDGGGCGGGGCGGGEPAAPTQGPTHGIYIRDLGTGGPVLRVVDRTSLVPSPNNLGSTFIETPAFPRIDATSGTYAFRGNSQPVWRYGDEGDEETVGTTGVYASVDGTLVTGASKLGGVPGFEFYAVPGSGTSFEVFPGSPSPTGSAIVFKGNYTEAGAARTGVFYRQLTAGDNGGTAPVQAIATSSSTLIPGSSTVFGSLSPPSAAAGRAAFAGYDDEADPTLGGIYVAPIAPGPPLTTVVGIGSPVPDRNGKASPDAFARLGEAVSFDGRFVAFWGSWGTETRTVTVVCPTEGNVARRELCASQNGGNPQYEFQVPVHQGVFVHDTRTGVTRMAAQTGPVFRDFVYWAFTGKVAGSIEGDDGEPATWRSSAYVAVAGGGGANFRLAFEATTSDGVTGVYLAAGPGRSPESLVTAVDTATSGKDLDPAAPEGAVVTEIGLERDGFRGDWLVVSAKMGSEENGMAGVYAARVRWP